MTTKSTKSIPELYDEIVDWYDTNRFKGLMEKNYLDLILNLIPESGSILDLGCGTGEPIAAYLVSQGIRICGIDASERMIARCKQRFPDQQWFRCDMRTLELNEKFDAIIAWDSFFHLNGEDQRRMFKVFKKHIGLNGILLFTSGPSAGEVISQMNGREFYHASLSSEDYRDLFNKNGFRELQYRPVDFECGDHTIWVAQAVQGINQS